MSEEIKTTVRWERRPGAPRTFGHVDMKDRVWIFCLHVGNRSPIVMESRKTFATDGAAKRAGDRAIARLSKLLANPEKTR